MSSPFAGDAALERDRLAQSRKRNERLADQDHRIPRLDTRAGACGSWNSGITSNH